MRITRCGKQLAFAFLAATLLLGQEAQVPNWWFTSDPKKVLADPLFHTLYVNQRITILSQIDPKFAKMSFEKQDIYLWNAETANLPESPPPKEIAVWNPSDPHCSTDFAFKSQLTKHLEAGGLEMAVSLDRYLNNYGFFESHVRIADHTGEAVLVQPQVFILKVSKPKRDTLYFEYPMRVWWQTVKRLGNIGPSYVPGERSTVRSANGQPIATIDSPDPVAKQDLKGTYDYIQTAGFAFARAIMPESLYETRLAPNAVAEGNVYFEASDGARELVVRLFVEGRAFEFPFSMPKK